MKNILAENMRRFGTKNLNEQTIDPLTRAKKNWVAMFITDVKNLEQLATNSAEYPWMGDATKNMIRLTAGDLLTRAEKFKIHGPEPGQGEFEAFLDLVRQYVKIFASIYDGSPDLKAYYTKIENTKDDSRNNEKIQVTKSKKAGEKLRALQASILSKAQEFESITDSLELANKFSDLRTSISDLKHDLMMPDYNR